MLLSWSVSRQPRGAWCVTRCVQAQGAGVQAPTSASPANTSAADGRAWTGAICTRGESRPSTSHRDTPTENKVFSHFSTFFYLFSWVFLQRVGPVWPTSAEEWQARKFKYSNGSLWPWPQRQTQTEGADLLLPFRSSARKVEFTQTTGSGFNWKKPGAGPGWRRKTLLLLGGKNRKEQNRNIRHMCRCWLMCRCWFVNLKI